ncbi:hypothetical protein AAY473_022044 [Plecturocebus cupreus]
MSVGVPDSRQAYHKSLEKRSFLLTPPRKGIWSLPLSSRLESRGTIGSLQPRPPDFKLGDGWARCALCQLGVRTKFGINMVTSRERGTTRLPKEGYFLPITQGLDLLPMLECSGAITVHCSLQLLSSKMGSRYVAQACLKLLASSNPPSVASQSSGITGMSHLAQPPITIYVISDDLSAPGGPKAFVDACESQEPDSVRKKERKKKKGRKILLRTMQRGLLVSDHRLLLAVPFTLSLGLGGFPEHSKGGPVTRYDHVGSDQDPLPAPLLGCQVFTQRLPRILVPISLKHIPRHHHGAQSRASHHHAHVALAPVARRGPHLEPRAQAQGPPLTQPVGQVAASGEAEVMRDHLTSPGATPCPANAASSASRAQGPPVSTRMGPRAASSRAASAPPPARGNSPWLDAGPQVWGRTRVTEPSARTASSTPSGSA